ncbi:MAG: undecaprenyldiphospho-muramoylpentapeptide beta-N-acetylglucosaminyltransferase [Flavobacteriales bacterium]|nr:undecaprenyldiphospho-muramoylpentapeptide beta-N-acetylglucosaminyltransferase [Flavobacteriales bacterium]MCB9196897.1 undecaprenyldiphospho-muramoylpentapeptide beta-N-acetylglucosaminyltransferase [Flavobacteriales bacterium]
MKQPRVIISGGGTGGHIFPALAIANAIKERYPEAAILFVGANGKMEMEKVPQAGYEIKGLDIVGIQRKKIWKNWNFPIKYLKSKSAAKSIVKEFNPMIAIGVGGYASGPTLIQSGNLGVPTLLQEQNSYAGLTNKLLAKKALKICVAYDHMEQFFPKDKIVMTGNPVRKDILSLEGKREEAIKHFELDPAKKTILLIGGSLGARTLNDSIVAGFQELSKAGVQIIWQTGKIYETEMAEKAKQHGDSNFKPMAFISRMDLAYAAADVVISRAGALSVSELCLVKKPCVLVPSPNVAEDHQTKNAKSLVDKNAALLVKDVESQAKLVPEILSLLNNEAKMEELSMNIAALGKPNAAEEICNEVMKIIGM